MLVGLLLGIVRFLMDVTYSRPHCGEVDTRPWFVRLHFLYYALMLFVICVVTMCVVSLFTEPVPIRMLGRLTWKTLDAPKYVNDDPADDCHMEMDAVLSDDKALNLQDCNEEEEVQVVGMPETFKEKTEIENWLLRIFTCLFLVILLSLIIWMG